MTPELGAWEEDDGLEFTGCYHGILMSAKTGTIPFQLNPMGENSWDCEPERMELGLVDELDKIVEEIRNPKQLVS